jgi:hypothetical protein
MSARELYESLQHRTQEVKDFMAGMIVDHLDGVVGEVEFEKAQLEGADSIWDLQ